MINIGISADLNREDDLGRNSARLLRTGAYKHGDVAVAGRPGFWSWVVIDTVEGDFVYFRQVSATEAARHGDLVAAEQH